MPKNALFEVGVEELPARFIDDAALQLRDNTMEWLNRLRISYDDIMTYSTPRRLAVLIKDVAAAQTTIEEEVKGPSVKIAKDDAGNWTKAAIGFTKGQGKTLDDIYTKEIKGTTYIFVKKHIEGKATFDLLPDFKEIIESIQFKQSMRWGQESIRYARPIRWVLAIYGEEIIPFEISGIAASNVTYGHRFLGEKITISDPSLYEKELLNNFVVADPKKRERIILDQISELENNEGFHIAVDDELLLEVRNLVEYPTVFCGNFSTSFLNLPSEVLITSMKEHQRYFPVKSRKGELLAYFVGVRNGDAYQLENVVKGNEKVLRARLTDAQFFYQEDQKMSIPFYLNKLERVVFQDRLGTIADKVGRITKITQMLAEKFQLNQQARKQVMRAAEISKFDLMTNMVNEFTELQGIMGEKYALHFGEDPVVAQTVREHYLPMHAADHLPQTTAGAIVSVADKLDTIFGCISVGITPTSSQDPYGLRRQGIGILKIIKEQKWNITLDELIEIVHTIYTKNSVVAHVSDHVMMGVHTFFNQRLQYLFKELGLEQDVIQAVLVNNVGQLSYALEKAAILSKKRNDPAFKPIEESLVRVINFAKKSNNDLPVNHTHFESITEQQLFETYKEVYSKFHKANDNCQAETALHYLAELSCPIHAFFEHNMVMDDNEAIRNNRISLISHIANLIIIFADLSLIEWKQQF